MALTGLILHSQRKEEQGISQCYGPKLLPSPCPLPKLWLQAAQLGTELPGAAAAGKQQSPSMHQFYTAGSRICPGKAVPFTNQWCSGSGKYQQLSWVTPLLPWVSASILRAR